MSVSCRIREPFVDLLGVVSVFRLGSFRVNMEQGPDQINLKRAPLCGKLQNNIKVYKQNTPMALSLSLSLSRLSLVAACLSHSGHDQAEMYATWATLKPSHSPWSSSAFAFRLWSFWFPVRRRE